MTIGIKICGLTDEAAIRTVVAQKADYAGFVYFPRSPRHIPLERAAQLKSQLGSIKSVLVTVDPDDALLKEAAATLKPDYIQLHGKETPERVQAIRKLTSAKLIKALQIKTGDDIAQSMRFSGLVEALLFDARPPELPGMLPGGNGLSFDWALLKDRQFPLPWFLSGGLTPENVAQAVRKSGASMVDVSSGVESAPGVKDSSLIEAFIKAARNA